MSDNPESAITSAADPAGNIVIRLNAAPQSREEAIRAVGQMLAESGAIEPAYIESMLKRETVADTWLGGGIAIPHGMIDDRHHILADKVAILQVPQGVEWSQGEKAKLIFGIAARGDGHLAVLRRLTRLLQRPESLQALFTTRDSAALSAALSAAAGAETAEASADAAAAPPPDLEATENWQMDYPNGLHARPAAAWIDAAKQAGIRLQARKGNAVSDIKSLVSLLQLGANCGDTLVFSAGGENAAAKLAVFMQAVKSLTAAEREQARKAAEQQRQALSKSWLPPSGQAPICGIAASPGLAVGAVYRLAPAEETAVEDAVLPVAENAALLQAALEQTKQYCRVMADDVTRRIGAQNAAIFKAQAELLNDDGLITEACRLMMAGQSAAKAWAAAVREAADRLAAMDNPLLAGRAADLRDIGRRALENIDPRYAAKNLENLPAEGKYIIVAEDILPSETAGLDLARVSGLATIAGGPTSHMAILARTMGLPALVAGGEKLAAAQSGAQAIINGDSGALWLSPTAADIAAAEAEMAKIAARQAEQAERRRLPAITPDGREIIVAANVNTPEQVSFALEQGAEGIGLMRTEFLFLERAGAPDEEDQYKIYRAMLDALDGKSLIVRALDIGGDKQVSYLNLPHEENPFLGVRGARLLLERPELLYPQLKALYRAAKDGGDISIMFPMIMSADEIIRLKAAAETVRESLSAPKIPLGIMVEVPSAALCADKLAAYVDFFSIGTNDLTQYTLAADRQNAVLAAQADSLHPAVLRMIEQTVAGAKLYDRFVGVCGGLAGDPFGAVLLAGLGVHELSMTPRDIPAVKARLRQMPYSRMQELAKQACAQESSAQVRALDTGDENAAEKAAAGQS